MEIDIRFTMRGLFDLLSPGGALPSEVPYLLTIHLADEPHLFNEIHCEFPDRAPYRFLVIGAAPETLKMLYGLDMTTGMVALMDSIDQAVEPINSSLAMFVVGVVLGVERLLLLDRVVGGRCLWCLGGLLGLVSGGRLVEASARGRGRTRWVTNGIASRRAGVRPGREGAPGPSSLPPPLPGDAGRPVPLPSGRGAMGDPGGRRSGA